MNDEMMEKLPAQSVRLVQSLAKLEARLNGRAQARSHTRPWGDTLSAGERTSAAKGNYS